MDSFRSQHVMNPKLCWRREGRREGRGGEGRERKEGRRGRDG